MNSAIELSLICPCYNSGKYLAIALESVLKQKTTHSFEIVVVMDPSSDDTAAVLSSFHDPRIRVISNPKRLGIGLSRRQGLEAAKGTYIGFLDADDFLEPSYVETMLQTLLTHQADAVDCNFFVFNDQSKQEHPAPLRGPERTLSALKAESWLLNDQKIRGFLWTKVFKKSLLLNPSISLPTGYLFEDMPIAFAAFSYAKKIVYLHQPLYHYRKAYGASATSKPQPHRALEHLNSFALIRIFADRSGNRALVQIVRHRYFRMKLSLLYDLSLARKAGLSKKEAHLLRRKLRLIKQKKPLPLENQTWSPLLAEAFRK